MLTAVQISYFETFGFLFMRQYFSPKEMGAITREFDQLIEADRKGKPFKGNESQFVQSIADSGEPMHIRAFDVVDGKRLTNSRVFAVVRPGTPDGFRVDTNGNLFTSAWGGIQVYTPEGELLGKVLVPEERTANCAFGGPDKSCLFITADTSLYSIKLNVTGVQTP